MKRMISLLNDVSPVDFSQVQEEQLEWTHNSSTATLSASNILPTHGLGSLHSSPSKSVHMVGTVGSLIYVTNRIAVTDTLVT